MLIDKLGKIPKKPKEDEPVVTSITIPSKKASMSIEIRRGDPNRPKTVKTYNSQFRSHGLSEEAPPPPSRKGLKKPPTQSIPGTSIPSTLLVKRSSPPPMPATISSPTTVKELLPPAEKKLKIDLTTAPATEKPGAVKFIAPKPKRKLPFYFIVFDNLVFSFRFRVIESVWLRMDIAFFLVVFRLFGRRRSIYFSPF